MKIITNHTILSDLLIERCELVPVVNRFGIGFGLEDKTIEEICDEHKLNIHFVVTVLNLYLNEDYQPGVLLSRFDVTLVLEYLKHSVEAYIHRSVSNIGKHFTPLIAMSNGNNEDLRMLHNLFNQFSEEISKHLNKDLENISDYPIELLSDLRTIMIKHVSSQVNLNLAYAVIFSINALEKELTFHNRVLNRILRPKLDELDARKIEDLNQAFGDENKPEESANQLSNREIEVLKLIVQGYLNKEIADQLNISLNTVLSHRKNIIYKTGVKTISGLTFYSISKGYVASGNFEFRQ